MSFPDSRGDHSGWQGNKEPASAAKLPWWPLHCQGENGRVVSPEREDTLCPLSIPLYATSTLRGLLHAAPGLPASFFPPSVLQHKDLNLPVLFWGQGRAEPPTVCWKSLRQTRIAYLCLNKITNKYVSMPYLSRPFCPGKWKTLLAGLGMLTEVLGPR